MAKRITGSSSPSKAKESAPAQQPPRLRGAPGLRDLFERNKEILERWGLPPLTALTGWEPLDRSVPYWCLTRRSRKVLPFDRGLWADLEPSSVKDGALECGDGAI